MPCMCQHISATLQLLSCYSAPTTLQHFIKLADDPAIHLAAKTPQHNSSTVREVQPSRPQAIHVIHHKH